MMIIGTVVGLSLCKVRPRIFVIRDDFDATGFEMIVLIDYRVETHLVLCGDNDAAS